MLVPEPEVFLSTYPVRGTTRTESVSCAVRYNFYPRTPCGVRPHHVPRRQEQCPISIHVPRAGYDPASYSMRIWPSYFYPRTPCGVRHQSRGHNARRRNFYPRTPCGVRQDGEMGIVTIHNISIHVPRAGYDRFQSGGKEGAQNFYPRTPCGVRPGYNVV